MQTTDHWASSFLTAHQHIEKNFIPLQC